MGEWSNLTQREKSNIIRFAIKNGVSDINTIRDTFNVYAKDSLANVDYNMAAAKASGFGSNGNGHYPDTFKKPNHPTFSDESIYHSEATPGGRWRGNTYEPSEFVLNQQGGWNQFLRGFSSQEQGTGAVPVFNGGIMLPEVEVKPSPKYKKSSEAYYDPETDTVFALDSIGEFYTHERFHARPNKEYLQKIAPYYENLNDSVLTSMGADLPFVNRSGDPSQYYSPEEIGARVAASLEMLKKAGVSKIDSDFVKESRKKELKYGDNYRDLLHMYNDDIITDLLNSYANGGSIHIKPSKRGTFTAAATKHGKSVQEFARQVLANKENYSPAMVKKANFARNAAGWKHSTGGPLYPFSFQKNPYWKTPVVRYDNGGTLGHQYGIGDFLSKLFAPTYSGDFSTAFTSARNDGNSYFKWNGNRYSTQWETEKYREEHPEEYVPEFAYTDAMNRIAREENTKLVKNGYIPELDAWQPHKSVEGGAKTIGYGLKLGLHNQAVLDELERNKSDKYPNGYISDAFALQQSANLLRDEYEPLAKKYWNSTFNDDSWDNLSPKMKSIILDYQYNVRGGIKEFPKLMRAIHDKDYKGIKTNYKRYTNNKRELGRNKGIAQELERLFGGYYSVYND